MLVRTGLMPSLSRIALNPAVNLVSLSWMRYLAGGAGVVAEVDGEIPSLLAHPAIIGIGCHPGDVDFPRADVNEQQNVDLHHASQSPDILGEEVAGPEGFLVSANELVPRSFTTQRSRIETGFLQDVLDRRPGDRDS